MLSVWRTTARACPAVDVTDEDFGRDCVNLVGGDFTLTLALSLRERG